MTAPDGQLCTLVPSSGTISNADVSNLALTCTTVQVDLTPQTLPDGVFGEAYSQTITASSSNGGTAPYSFSLASGSVPVVLFYRLADCCPARPTLREVLPSLFERQMQTALSASGNIQSRFLCRSLPLHLPDLPDGKASNAYVPATLSATGGAAPYSFQVTTGALPAGLSWPVTGFRVRQLQRVRSPSLLEQPTPTGLQASANIRWQSNRRRLL